MWDSSCIKVFAKRRVTHFGSKIHLLAVAIVLTAVITACSQYESPASYSNNELTVTVYEGEVTATSRLTNLDEKAVSGDLAIDVTIHEDVSSVRFYLDDPEMAVEPVYIASSQPFRFILDTKSLSNGAHNVTTAAALHNDRITSPITVNFTVDNSVGPVNPPVGTDPQPTPNPQPSPVPEPGPKPEPSPPALKGTLFISPDGSDHNDGRSVTSPLRTIQRAVKLVEPGDIVQLRGGVYSEYNYSGFVTSGRSDAPITFMSFPGERAVIDGSSREPQAANPAVPQLIRVFDVDWYVFQDLTFRNSAGRALSLEGNHHIVRNVVTHDNHGDGIYINGSHNLIEDSVTYNNNSYMNGGDSADGVKIPYGTGNIIRRVVSFNNSDDGIDVWDTTDTLIEYSVAYGNGIGPTGNGNGFKLSNGSRSDSRNVVRFSIAFSNRKNNFTDNAGGGIVAYNNTSWDAGDWGFVFRGRAGQTRHVVVNNLSYQEGQSRGALLDIMVSGGLAPTQTTNSWNIGIQDPLFVSTLRADPGFLHLSKTSPAINRGTDVGLAFDGPAPDIGALQFRN